LTVDAQRGKSINYKNDRKMIMSGQ